ncbi:MAG: CinA-like protein [Verrucomicrobiales bacterium]|nr:CinA-like protein [Verrucomicrobiales bacterium]
MGLVMRLEVINTGTELLLGSTLNTHLGFLGETLLPLGLRVGRQVTIPDGEIIRDAVLESVGRADIVIVTGGLGPTSDDITRELIAELLNLPLEENEGVMRVIRLILSRRNRELNEQTRRQAMVPRGATVLANAWGTAPGLYLPPHPVAAAGGELSPHLILLPGPPRELRPMVREVVLPLLGSICEGRTVPRGMRNFRIANLGESQVAATVEEPITSLGDVELGYCARAGEVIVRVLGTPEHLAAAETIVSAAFPENYYSAQEFPLEHTVVDLLTRMGQTVSTAESCTGGLVAHRLTNVPGASAVFPRGYVTYANDAKTDILGVPMELLANHGAVSAEVCAAMAEGCRAAADTDHALALTGIAGPGGGSDVKPVGTVFIGLASRGHGQPVVEHHIFNVERETFKQLASQIALDLLRRRLIRLI